MTPTIREFEMAGYATWPARHEDWLGEWMIRATDGMTRRNNSVTPLGDPGTDLGTAIDRAEVWFTEHGVPPVFRLTDLASAALPARLIERGYQKTDTTLVMSRSALPGPADPAVAVTDTPIPQWLDLLAAGRSRATHYRDNFLELLAATEVPSGFGWLDVDGQIAAIGQISMSRSFGVVFNMKTESDHRRSGYAGRVLRTLIDHAHARGADLIMLQVQQDNPAAIGLYAGAGFSTRYDYRYYER